MPSGSRLLCRYLVPTADVEAHVCDGNVLARSARLSCHLRQEVKSYTFGTHPRRLQTQAERSDRLQTVATVELGLLDLRMDLRELDPLG